MSSSARSTYRRTDPILDIAIPIGIRIFMMLCQIIMTMLVVPRSTRTFDKRFLIWDAKNYRSIVDHGYPSKVIIDPITHALIDGKELAFSPVYPYIVRLIKQPLSLTTNQGLLFVAIVSSCVLSIGVHLFVRRLGGTREQGWLACVLIAAAPMSVTLQMGYAEPLFLALTVFAMLCASTKHWSWATILGVLAAGTRPFGPALGMALLIYAIFAMHPSWSMSEKIHAFVPAIATLVTTPMIWWLDARHTGMSEAFFVVQEHGWHTRFDMGTSTWQLIQHASHIDDISPTNAIAFRALVVAILVASLGLLCIIVRRTPSMNNPRLIWPIIAYAFIVIMMTIGSSNYWYSKPRELLALTPLVIPIAMLTRVSNLRPIKTSTSCLVISSVTISMVFNTFMICIWRHAM